jgi:Na+-translocating ferredoxin:NAD+ oxidoreductase subunit D
MNDQKKTLSVDQTTLKNTYLYTGALAILAVAATVIFGLNVLLMIVVAYATGLAFEFLFAKLRKKPLDYGWMVTPLLVALLLPPTAPWWLVMYATGFGLVFGKLIFGGSGKYIFNPALVGALFAYISFAQYAVAISWPIPGSDLLAGATPLLSLNRGQDIGYSVVQLLLGQAPGTTGETFRLGIIILGLVFLL